MVSEKSPAELLDNIKKPPTHRLGLFNGKLPILGPMVKSNPYLEKEIEFQ